MSAFDKFNRSSSFPKYQVTYAKARELPTEKAYPVTWVGTYNGKMYGRECYVDIINESGQHVRANLPKYLIEDIDELAHDSECMKAIKDGTVSIVFHPYETKNGSKTISVEWLETKKEITEITEIDSDKLPF